MNKCGNSSSYYRPAQAPDYSYEDSLIAECRRLEGEVASLKATLALVRKVLADTVANLGEV